MKYKIVHTNTFKYDDPVDQSMNTIRLRPLEDECQQLISYRTDIHPLAVTKGHEDVWGNYVEEFFIAEPHSSLEVITTSIVTVQRSPFLQEIRYSPDMKALFESPLYKEHYAAYLAETAYTKLYMEQVQAAQKEAGSMKDPLSYAIQVMEYLYRSFTYDKDFTNVETTAEAAFEHKKGVCQDFSHVMLGILRASGIPSRYVSGYLYVGEDSALKGDAASHAWVEVMVPGIGWAGLDPTNNVEALSNHIRVGTGRDYADVSPLQGKYRGGESILDVRVSVQRLDADEPIEELQG
ncbi:transglutaminase domain-containing protein [Paenibacillus provencensis]|uniref:Transglutaminase domain-containing protein n=1 Tax=Paenibacillus provencensis TaxID=441151 RepID=A0ABW3PXY5_9BACL|nr:transglutaminase family protein [Paenibacillus sp. MER 78]MCM3128546.1 transglutaminase family protein [Paenibacillus sp. MER 78]